tara:strand:+ start:52 stop:2358 length:2307 start_codon:yes stop_codon:yes gene_type:complete
MINWDKILKDFAYKCKGGAPDFINSDHLNLLRESLLKFGWKEFATNEFLGNLREGEDKDYKGKGTRTGKPGEYKYDYSEPSSERGGKKKDKKDEKGGKVVASAEVKDEGKVVEMEETEEGLLQEKFEEPIAKPEKENESLRADYKEPRPKPLELMVNGKKVTVNTNPIDENDLAQVFPPGTPKKYIQLITRMLNAKADSKDSKKPAMLNFIEGSGAGIMPAQGAEVMTMAASTMDDDQFKAFMSVINQHNSNLADKAETQKAEIATKEKTIESQRAELEKELSKKPKDKDKIKSLKDNIKNLRKELSPLKKEVKKLSKENQPIFDNDWLQSISGARGVIRDFADESGTEVSHCAWDLREDVTNMGFNYDSKGFSTDVFVRTDDGRIIQVSLKKDTNVNLAQPSVGFTTPASVKLVSKKKQKQHENNKKKMKKMGGLPPKSKSKERAEYERLEKENYDIESEGLEKLFENHPNANPRVAQKKQLKLCNEAIEKIDETEKKTIQNVTDKDVEDIINNNKQSFDGYPPEYVKDVVNVFKGMTPPINDATLRAALKAAGMKATTRSTEKAKNAINRILARKNPESVVAKRHQKVEADIRQNDVDLQEGYLKACVDSPEMKAEVMNLIRSKFPVKSLLDGEEKIALGGLAGDKDIISDIFDEDDYDKIESNLEVEEDPVTGKQFLVYKVKGGGAPIRVAEVVIRNKGIGYNNMESSTFELKLSDQMKWHLYCANINKHGENKVNERISDTEEKTQKKLSSPDRFGPCPPKGKK